METSWYVSKFKLAQLQKFASGLENYEMRGVFILIISNDPLPWPVALTFMFFSFITNSPRPEEKKVEMFVVIVNI